MQNTECPAVRYLRNRLIRISFFLVERTLFQMAIRLCKHIKWTEGNKVLSTAQINANIVLCIQFGKHTHTHDTCLFWWSLLLTSIIKAFTLFILPLLLFLVRTRLRLVLIWSLFLCMCFFMCKYLCVHICILFTIKNDCKC